MYLLKVVGAKGFGPLRTADFKSTASASFAFVHTPQLVAKEEIESSRLFHFE